MSSPIPSPTIAAMLTPPPTVVPAASPYATLAPPAATAGDASEAAVRRVIQDYERAIEGRDITLFRSLMPELSQDNEKKLRESFKAIKSWAVGITYDSIQVEGDRATVRVSRQDMVNGRQMPAQTQTFSLARFGGSWRIQSIQ